MLSELSCHFEKLMFVSYISYKLFISFVINIQSQKEMHMSIRDVLTITFSISILALIGAHHIEYLSIPEYRLKNSNNFL
jgi:hypothetical protein